MKWVKYALGESVHMQNLVCFPTEALLRGYDLEITHYTDGQLSELYKGLESNIDVLAYANYKLSESQMAQIRLGLVDKVDISCYNSPYIKAEEMFKIRTALKQGISIYRKRDEESVLHYKEMVLCGIDGVFIENPERLNWKIIRSKRLRHYNQQLKERSCS